MKHHQRVLVLSVLAIVAASTDASGQMKGRRVARKDTASTLQLSGFMQADAIYDFEQNNPDWFDVNRPSRLPAFAHEFGGDNRTWLSARQSRFGVKVNIPTGNHELKGQFDFDMFGVGPDAGQTTIRLRHAYGQWGQVGAGQLESPFMDLDVFPNILEYWGPNGMLFFRNVMVYWQPIERTDGTRLTFAVERPGASGDAGQFADRVELQNVLPRFPWPDFSASYRQGGKWGYAKLAGIVRSLRWDDVLADTFDLSGGATGWGVSLSTGIKAGPHDLLHLQGIYGKGVQNYFNDAPIDVGVVDNRADIRRPVLGDPLPILGLVAYLDHTWNSRWSSAIGYSRVDVDNSSGQAADAFRVGQYASVNLLNTPVPNVLIGGEFQWGYRSNFADGFSTNDYRLQFSFKYSYSRTFGGGTDD